MNDEGSASAQAQRWVVKLGSSLVTNHGSGLDHEAIADWSAQLAAVVADGREVTIVSSGAVAEGMARLQLRARPGDLAQLQAAAAVGQLGLVEAYARALGTHDLITAQILLTHEDCAERERYLNARNTFRALLKRGIVPVVNENDTVATDEIRFGDNDTLAALTVDLVEADLLVILTDQPGLMSADPQLDPDARLLARKEADDPELDAVAGSGSGRLGRGGMRTKLLAARRVAKTGAMTIIADGRSPGVLSRIHHGDAVGTLLTPGRKILPARKRWIAGQVRTRGRLKIDDGAARMISAGGKSLLPVGVVGVEGAFRRGDLVACIDPQGHEVARGLINYDAEEARRLAGQASSDIASILGRPGESELIHRDNLVLN